MLGVDHDNIILLSTPFPTIPMLGNTYCCGVIVFYVGNKRCCIVLYCKSEQFTITHLQSPKKTECMIQIDMLEQIQRRSMNCRENGYIVFNAQPTIPTHQGLAHCCILVGAMLAHGWHNIA